MLHRHGGPKAHGHHRREVFGRKCKPTFEDGFYDALWVATPCGTFSPLREIPPGPGVLRTVRHITGLPASQLSMAEQKQLKEGNILVSRSASSVSLAKRRKVPWGWENPIHPPDKPSLWMMPSAAAILKEKGTLCADFDQCTTGLETTKPTRVAYEHISLHEIQGCKCNHPPVEQISSKGKKYYAPHPSPAQRWRTGPDGKMERASKALGEYTARLSGILRCYPKQSDYGQRCKKPARPYSLDRRQWRGRQPSLTKCELRC